MESGRLKLSQRADIPEIAALQNALWEEHFAGFRRNEADFLIRIGKERERPKVEAAGGFSYSVPVERLVDEVVRDRFQFVGVRPIIPTLFEDLTGAEFMWEFVREMATGDPADRKYLYVPVEDRFLEVLGTVLPRLVFFCPDQQHSFPVRPAFVDLNIEGIPVVTVKVRRLTHPFLPGFIGTGRLIEFERDNLYEYFDVRGWWGPVNRLQWSSIRPHQLDFPRGVPWDSQLREQPVGPFRLSALDPWVGEFTGFETTEQYGPHKYWLFRRANGSVFLDRFLDPTFQCAQTFCPTQLNDVYRVDDQFCFGSDGEPPEAPLDTQVFFDSESLSFYFTSWEDSFSVSMLYIDAWTEAPFGALQCQLLDVQAEPPVVQTQNSDTQVLVTDIGDFQCLLFSNTAAVVDLQCHLSSNEVPVIQ